MSREQSNELVKVTGPTPNDDDIVSYKVSRFYSPEKHLLEGGLANRKALWLISIEGNKYCSNGYFAGMLKHLTTPAKAEVRFSHYADKVTIVIVDSLAKFNMARGLNFSQCEPPQQELYLKQARALALFWLKKAMDTFANVLELNPTEAKGLNGLSTASEIAKKINEFATERNKPFEIKLWDNMESSASYVSHKNDIDRAVASDAVESALRADSYNYTARKKQAFECEFCEENSYEYLKAEAMVLISIAKLDGYDAIIYPGPLPTCFGALKKELHETLKGATDQHVNAIAARSNTRFPVHLSPHFRREIAPPMQTELTEGMGQLNGVDLERSTNFELEAHMQSPNQLIRRQTFNDLVTGIMSMPSFNQAAKLRTLLGLAALLSNPDAPFVLTDSPTQTPAALSPRDDNRKAPIDMLLSLSSMNANSSLTKPKPEAQARPNEEMPRRQHNR